MNKLKTLGMMAALVLFFAACNNNEPTPEPVEVPDGTYVGTLVVDQNDGTSYAQENVSVSIQKTDGNKMSVVMQKVKFSERMPVTLDMTIPGVSTSESTQGLSLEGDNIIPTAMGGEFPAYTITLLEGEVTPQKLELSMNCGSYPLTFSGTVKE